MSAKILLADDSITIQKVVNLTLRDTDYQLISVNNGDEAVTKAIEEKPDIIIADVSMPGKTGYEVCREIKSHPELKSVPVILMHGTFETFNEELAKQVGADDYLTKPFESRVLLEMIEKHLRKETQPPVEEAAPAAGGEEEGLLLEEEVEELEEPAILEAEGGEEELALTEDAETLEPAEEVLEEGGEEDYETEEELLEAEPVEEGGLFEEGELLEAETVEAEVLAEEVPEAAAEIPLEEEVSLEEPVLAEEAVELEAGEEETELVLEEEVSGTEEATVADEWSGGEYELAESPFEEPAPAQEPDIEGVTYEETTPQEPEKLGEPVIEDEIQDFEEVSQEAEPFDEVISSYEQAATTPSREEVTEPIDVDTGTEEISEVFAEEPQVEPEEEVIPLHEEAVEEKTEIYLEEEAIQAEEAPAEELTPPEAAETVAVAPEISEKMPVDQIEKAIRDAAEKIAWEIVPDLVEMIVKRELDKRLNK